MVDTKLILKDKQKLNNITEQIFKQVDINNSGFIEKNELEQIMVEVTSEIGIDKPTKEEIEEILKELDDDDDGKLSIKELYKHIINILQMFEYVCQK
ncbi:hypothetical protein IMG5_124560 [Ichthyophthirius multifiliis]|uniref:EF-hand domain-containing protein n=1 Tax=Ichthyophthirius multifiliis TaxID=5932 RepID=G0QVM0_ICHMU|nr:hypothetical protein IMG5_124560 [Ichthyophthirius multifiliis]EGR30743.1 hypothetical protein IMG5_124560 [Ichthyophthirius multifiliis]|eukprot:XP_004032330.1 hypothetical protein IMG5_124560 [Ichthyophthirius multifiliis]